MSAQLTVLLVFIIASFNGPFGGNMVLPLFRNIQESFQTTKLVVNLTVTLYMIPFSILQIFSGVMSDLFYGRKRVVITGSLLYTLGSLIAFYSENILAFLFSRALQGIGSAFIVPITMAMIGDFFGPEKRGKIMGLGALATTLGATLGPLVGGYVSLINWRLSFALMALFGVFILVTSLLMPEKGREGTNFSNLWVTISTGLSDPRVLSIGFLGMMIFFTRMSIFTFLSNTVLYPPYNLPSYLWGSYLFFAGLGGMVAGVLAGFLTDVLGRKRVAVIGFTFLVMAILSYMLLNWFMILPILLVLQAFLSTFAMTPLNTLAVEINPRLRGTVSALYGSMRFLGYALAPVVPYPLYAIYGIYAVFALDFVLAFIGLIIFSLVFKENSL
ncbi:MAG: MFS transporter [Candidatus Njordarchaeales archaeon]